MAGKSLVVDAGFLIALWNPHDRHHAWAVATAGKQPPPWITCEAVLSETEHLLGTRGRGTLRTACRRGALRVMPIFHEDSDAVLNLMDKYEDVPMSIADACLVRFTEVLPSALLLTTDSDFKTYRRNIRELIPCLLPSLED